MSDHNGTITHIYGTLGLICGAAGLIAVAVKDTFGIYGWLLFASGWFSAGFLAWFLVRNSRQLTNIIANHDTEILNAAARSVRLEDRIVDMQREIDRRHATLDYLSSQLMSGPAIPRKQARNKNTHEMDDV